MTPVFGKIAFWFVVAVVVACIEIESEGKHGWAEKMPTWYRCTGFWARLFKKLMSGKPLTGYHAFMFFLPALMFHAHFVMAWSWSVGRELEAWALYLAWCPLWDYFWFVLNPHYQGRFKRGLVWWHAKSRWVAGLFPIDYLYGVAASFACASLASLADGTSAPLSRHAVLLVGFAVGTAALHLAAPSYRRWYARMRKRDERDQAGIFHPND